METTYRVALHGFGPFEQRALEDYFRQTRAQAPAFVPAATLILAELCVVDGDRASAVEDVRRAGLLDRAVFVGAEPPAGAVVHLGRPINPRQVARALETLLLSARYAVEDFEATAPAVLTLTAAHMSRIPSLESVVKSAPDRPADSTPEPTADPAPPGRRVATPDVHFPFDVLVVEGRPTATSPLIAQLDRVGCRVTVARNGEEASQLIAQSGVRIVFCDTQMREVDGMTLCQQIKSVKKGAPSVVLMSPQVSASDKVRAQLAGADALLAKPIAAEDLLDVLRSASNRRRRAR